MNTDSPKYYCNQHKSEMCKTEYILQKFFLVATFCDEEK